MYRIAKIFEVESGHILSKHPEKCKNPHGHSRKVEVIIKSNELDDNDMVMDFKIFKLAIGELIDKYDHSIMVNKNSAEAEFYTKHYERVITTDGDPTTEVMAKLIFEEITQKFQKGHVYLSPAGNSYEISTQVKLESVKVWETSSTWAEYTK